VISPDITVVHNCSPLSPGTQLRQHAGQAPIQKRIPPEGAPSDALARTTTTCPATGGNPADAPRVPLPPGAASERTCRWGHQRTVAVQQGVDAGQLFNTNRHSPSSVREQGEVVGPDASLGELFVATTPQRRYLRRYANRWIDLARTRVLRGEEPSAVAKGAVALRPNAAPHAQADAC